MEKCYNSELAHFIYFLEENFNYFFKDKLPEDICQEFKVLFKVEFLDSQNRDFLNFFIKYDDLYYIIFEKIFESEQYHVLMKHQPKIQDDLLQFCLNHHSKNIDSSFVSFILLNIGDKKINKDKFFEFLPHMSSSYLNNLSPDTIFSSEEIEKILSKFSSSDILLTFFEKPIKDYIIRANKNDILSIIYPEEIVIDLFPDDYFLDLNALKKLTFLSPDSIYNQKNFEKLEKMYVYENLLDNYLFFQYFNEEDKNNPMIVLKLLNSFSTNELYQRKNFIEELSPEILKKEIIQDFLFEHQYFDFKPLTNQIRLLKTIKEQDYNINITNLTKYLNEDVKLFLEIHVQSPKMYYDFFIYYLENEYVNETMQFNQQRKKKNNFLQKV